MDKKHFVLGGDIKKSLTEGYHLDFKSIFKESWQVTRQHYWPLIAASIFTLVIIVTGYSMLLQMSERVNEGDAMLVNYLLTLLVAPPLLTALQMMGVNHAIGLKSKSTDLFNYFNITIKLSLATVIISLISNGISLLLTELLGDMGLALSVVVLLYVNMAFSLVYPLIAEKKMTAVMALKFSFKLVNKNLRQFTLLFILIILLAVIALLPSGLGLLIFVPFYFNLMGVVYRQVCGVGVIATAVSEQNNPPSDKFDA